MSVKLINKHDARLFWVTIAVAFGLGFVATLKAPWSFALLPTVAFAMTIFCVWRPHQLRLRLQEARMGKGANDKAGEMFGVHANWYFEVAPVFWVTSFFSCFGGLVTGAMLFLL